MNKTLVFDMDGTIVDFYGVDNWLFDLEHENVRPYIKAKPLCDMDTLKAILDIFKAYGWRIVVTTWLSKNGSKKFNMATREAKLEWLDRYNFPYDEIHIVKYGTTKADCTRNLGGFQILIDDNINIRKGWTLGTTIDANNDIIKSLVDILMEVF